MPAASNKGVMVNSNRATANQDMDREDMPNRLLSTAVEDMLPQEGNRVDSQLTGLRQARPRMRILSFGSGSHL